MELQRWIWEGLERAEGEQGGVRRERRWKKVERRWRKGEEMREGPGFKEIGNTAGRYGAQLALGR